MSYKPAQHYSSYGLVLASCDKGLMVKQCEEMNKHLQASWNTFPPAKVNQVFKDTFDGMIRDSDMELRHIGRVPTTQHICPKKKYINSKTFETKFQDRFGPGSWKKFACREFLTLVLLNSTMTLKDIEKRMAKWKDDAVEVSKIELGEYPGWDPETFRIDPSMKEALSFFKAKSTELGRKIYFLAGVEPVSALSVIKGYNNTALNFPAGRKEEGEEPEAAALREGQEECGIDLSSLEYRFSNSGKTFCLTWRILYLVWIDGMHSSSEDDVIRGLSCMTIADVKENIPANPNNARGSGHRKKDEE